MLLNPFFIIFSVLFNVIFLFFCSIFSFNTCFPFWYGLACWKYYFVCFIYFILLCVFILNTYKYLSFCVPLISFCFNSFIKYLFKVCIILFTGMVLVYLCMRIHRYFLCIICIVKDPCSLFCVLHICMFVFFFPSFNNLFVCLCFCMSTYMGALKGLCINIFVCNQVCFYHGILVLLCLYFEEYILLYLCV